MSLYTQLKEFSKSVVAGDIAPDDVAFMNIGGVDKGVPISELTTKMQGGIPAQITTIQNDITAIQAVNTTQDSEIAALSNGVLFLTPEMYGAIGDGLSHPLSSVYGTLAAAQAVYSFATALTQEIDYCALKKMSNTALGADTVENGETNRRLNRPMLMKGATYYIGNDIWLIRNASGIKIWGAGKRATTIQGNGIVLQFDGLWYSELADFTIQSMTGSGNVALDVDGNVPGHPYATRGVQGNSFRNLLIDGGGGNYAFAMTRQGGSGGQGSENKYFNVHVQNATICYFQNGYNALNNAFYGGNFQNYVWGVYLVAGSVAVFDVGFQSTRGYLQITGGGYDIDCSSGGVGDSIFVAACRTESLRFYNGAGSQTANISSITQTPSLYSWTAGAAVTLNTAIIKTISGKNILLVVTTAGVSAGVEPAWNATGTTNDGTAVWTATTFDAITIVVGKVDYKTINLTVGNIYVQYEEPWNDTNADYTVGAFERYVMVDASGGPRTVTLPADASRYSRGGRTVTIKKYDTSANAITIASSDGSFIDFNPAGVTIPGGSRGFVTLAAIGGGTLTKRWVVVAKG